jgi:transcription antitermination factor NusG
MNKKWYAVYTKPRWEKKVSEVLTLKNIENYCPLNRVVRQWSDRKKIVQEPLFTSYVFVHITERQIGEIKKNAGVLNMVYWQGKPAVIREVEIEIIKKFLNEYSDVQLEKTIVSIDDPVKITTGSLLDREGTIVSIKNNIVRVALPTLGYSMYADLEKSSVVKVSKQLSPVHH